MSSAPSPQPPLLRRKKRRLLVKRSTWKEIPNALKIVIGLGVVAMVAIPFVRPKDDAPPVTRQVVEPLHVVGLPSTDLVLGEARFEAASKTIKGVVENRAATPYKDVVVSYNIKDVRGGDLEAVDATIARLGPHAKATFETEPLPNNARTYDLREITGAR